MRVIRSGDTIFPACTGVIQAVSEGKSPDSCIPHISGGDPIVDLKALKSLQDFNGSIQDSYETISERNEPMPDLCVENPHEALMSDICTALNKGNKCEDCSPAEQLKPILIDQYSFCIEPYDKATNTTLMRIAEPFGYIGTLVAKSGKAYLEFRKN